MVDVLGPRSGLLGVRKGKLWRRHLDHIHDKLYGNALCTGIDIPEESVVTYTGLDFPKAPNTFDTYIQSIRFQYV